MIKTRCYGRTLVAPGTSGPPLLCVPPLRVSAERGLLEHQTLDLTLAKKMGPLPKETYDDLLQLPQFDRLHDLRNRTRGGWGNRTLEVRVTSQQQDGYVTVDGLHHRDKLQPRDAGQPYVTNGQ